MAAPHILELDLDLVKEPDDLWSKLFFAWVRNLEELNATNMKRLTALEDAVMQLNTAVAAALPEQPDELRAAIGALEDLRETFEHQSTRSVHNVEKLAVIAKQIIESQSED